MVLGFREELKATTRTPAVEQLHRLLRSAGNGCSKQDAVAVAKLGWSRSHRDSSNNLRSN